MHDIDEEADGMSLPSEVSCLMMFAMFLIRSRILLGVRVKGAWTLVPTGRTDWMTVCASLKPSLSELT